MIEENDAPSPLARPGARRNARRTTARPESQRIGRPVDGGALVGRLLDAPTRRFGFADARLVADWASIVGDEVAAVSQPLRIDRRSRKLVLRVRPAGALLLQHQEPQLLERINTHFGIDLVWRLELVQGPLPPRVALAAPPPLAAEAERAIAQAVVDIEPPALRRALADLGAAIKRRTPLA